MTRSKKVWMAAVLPAVLVWGSACSSGKDAAGPSTTVATTSATRPAPVTTVPVSDVFPGIWPFASQAEADAYGAGADQTFRDPAATAREFAIRYVGMAGAVAFKPASSNGVVEVLVGVGRGEGGAPVSSPRPVMTVFLKGLGAGGAAPWTVVGARAVEIAVDRPAAMSSISSPVAVAGKALAFEGAVSVAVREDGMLADQSLGTGSVTGGGSEVLPFDGQITFRAPTKPAGAVVFYEVSAADGQGVLKATVVRVKFASTDKPPAT